MNKEIANFFWHGELTVFEKSCIQSFVKNGFDVHLWSYNNLQIDGAKSRDASEILSKDLLYKYVHHFNERTSEHSSLAAFSDAFRYKVLQHNSGWWFDTDCYCLKDQLEFYKLRQNKNVVLGFEDHSTVSANNAVIWGSELVLNELNTRVETISKSKKYVLSFWGELGPTLVTQTCLDLSLQNQFLSVDNFFAITLDDKDMFVDADKKQIGKSLIADSYLTHIWTSSWIHENIDKTNPPENCLLKELIDFSYVNNYIVNKNSSINHYNRAISISQLYQSLLKRSPDRVGWESYLNSELSMDQIKNDIINSPEYKRLTL